MYLSLGSGLPLYLDRWQKELRENNMVVERVVESFDQWSHTVLVASNSAVLRFDWSVFVTVLFLACYATCTCHLKLGPLDRRR